MDGINLSIAMVCLKRGFLRPQEQEVFLPQQLQDYTTCLGLQKHPVLM